MTLRNSLSFTLSIALGGWLILSNARAIEAKIASPRHPRKNSITAKDISKEHSTLDKKTPDHPAKNQDAGPQTQPIIHVLPKAFRPLGALENHRNILIWGQFGRIIRIDLEKNSLRKLPSSFVEIDQAVVDNQGYLLLGRSQKIGQIALIDVHGREVQTWTHDGWSSVFSTPTCRVAMGALGDLIHLHGDGSRRVLRPPQSVPLTHNPPRHVLRYDSEQRIFCSVGDYLSKSRSPRGECRSEGSRTWSFQDDWNQAPFICGSYIAATTVLGTGKDKKWKLNIWSTEDGRPVHYQDLGSASKHPPQIFCSSPGLVTFDNDPTSVFELPFLKPVAEHSAIAGSCPRTAFRRRLKSISLCVDQKNRLHVGYNDAAMNKKNRGQHRPRQ